MIKNIQILRLNQVSGGNRIHVSCILQQHSFSKLDFPTATSRRLFQHCNDSKTRVRHWLHCIVASCCCYSVAMVFLLCIAILLLHMVFSYTSRDSLLRLLPMNLLLSPLSLSVSGPFVSRLPQSGPRLGENGRPSWGKFVWTEPSRLKQKSPTTKIRSRCFVRLN